MPRFFSETKDINNGIVTLRGENAHHISFSLRAKAGDMITVCDGEGNVHECEITAFYGDAVDARVISTHESDTEPPYKAILCQAIPKSDKMDMIIQKAVELGVYRIIPFESRNCVAHIKPEARARKTERYNKIALSAAKQCGRGIVPQVSEPVPFDDIMKINDGEKLFCYECGGAPLYECFGSDTVYFMIGPEGGFSPDEAQKASDNGWKPVTLGKRILRTETASSYLLSVMSYIKENHKI